MALLELLPGPAPARVVAADLVLVGHAAGLDLRRWLGGGVGRVLGGLGDPGGDRAARHGGRRGLESRRLVGRRPARVVQPGLARAPAAADGPLAGPAATTVAVLALDLDLDVEDVA